MTNPVSPIPSAQLPLYTTKIVDEDGNATTLFHRFLLGLYDRTGAAQGATVTDATAIAEHALTEATAAAAAAGVAQSTANSAETSAAAAQATATAAEDGVNGVYGLVLQVQNTALFRSSNLSDVASKTISRTNLGVSTVPLAFTFDTLTNSLKRGVPIVQNLTVAANFAGSVAWSGVATTSDALFTFERYRAGSLTPLGTLTFVHGGTGVLFSSQPSFTLVSGDVFVLSCPAIADATLAQVGITISASLT